MGFTLPAFVQGREPPGLSDWLVRPMKYHLCCSGNFIREDKNDTEKARRKYGISPTLMGWYEIQQAFYRMLPAGTVTFDSR